MQAAKVVGRELGLFGDAVRAAVNGSGSVVLVRGEPGTGTTSLVRVAAARAARPGVAYRVGRAPERAGRAAVLAVAASCGHRPGRVHRYRPVPRLRAVTRRLVADAERAGSLVVMEYLHWADPGTVALFVHVGLAIENSRLTLIGTDRDTETGRGDLLPALGGLAGNHG